MKKMLNTKNKYTSLHRSIIDTEGNKGLSRMENTVMLAILQGTNYVNDCGKQSIFCQNSLVDRIESLL